MEQVLISLKKNIIRNLLLFLLIFPVIFFLNNGFSLEPYWRMAQVFIFTIVFVAVILWPKARKTIFSLGLVLIILMAIFYTLRLIELADITGSTGSGLVMINLVSYLPQLIKLGYIKNL